MREIAKRCKVGKNVIYRRLKNPKNGATELFEKEVLEFYKKNTNLAVIKEFKITNSSIDAILKKHNCGHLKKKRTTTLIQLEERKKVINKLIREDCTKSALSILRRIKAENLLPEDTELTRYVIHNQILKLKQEKGIVTKKQRKVGFDREEFKKIIYANYDKSLQEIADIMGISMRSLCNRFMTIRTLRNWYKPKYRTSVRRREMFEHKDRTHLLELGQVRERRGKKNLVELFWRTVNATKGLKLKDFFKW